LVSLENLLDHILDLFQESSTPSLPEKQKVAVELLDSWSTLLVLDNMETVQDGRILKFVQDLPHTTKCKVLLTSRHKTGGWELPIPITELNFAETKEFVTVKSQETSTLVPLDDETIRKINNTTGGLPLAIQWSLGRFRKTGDLTNVLTAVQRADSPILEFSFRSIWNVLSADAKAALAILSVFDSPPDIQQVSIATEWDLERLERAFTELSEVTLINANTQIPDGKVVYVALPITLAFARNQLAGMGDFELNARKRLQKFTSQMNLQQWELQSFSSTFQKYKIINENEKRAVILCRRAESELFAGNIDNADLLFLQARQTAPNSAYALALCASGQLFLTHIGKALELIRAAEGRVTKETGALVYSVAARISDAQNDKGSRLKNLEKALSYAPEDVILQHQYGVALSRAGRTQDAIVQFDHIIERETSRAVPTDTLLMALRTRIINYRRQKQFFEAARDLSFAKELVSKYSHLQSQARYIDDLEDEGGIEPASIQP
jgi:tetratricopeptide (TPR) repeat protein